MFSAMASRARWRTAPSCLKRVNILDKDASFPAELSGGMQKRVGIARAIAMNPKYLFCDEPNSGLDPQTSILIDELIKEITEEFKTTTIVITHDMNSVMETGENIIFIHKGRKWWQGTGEELELHLRCVASATTKELNEGIHLRQIGWIGWFRSDAGPSPQMKFASPVWFRSASVTMKSSVNSINAGCTPLVVLGS
jgi:phospholipid/cholesterol/gamma-HCH transport system ATP-binding protein